MIVKFDNKEFEEFVTAKLHGIGIESLLLSASDIKTLSDQPEGKIVETVRQWRTRIC